MTSGHRPFHVAIVGGGLAGLALAIALESRRITYTIYEARGAFTEIGAGINFARNGLSGLQLINPSLGEEVRNISTRNPHPHENTWMFFRYGASNDSHEEGDIIWRVDSPSVGNMTMHRQELLQILATRVPAEHTKFNKKLEAFDQDAECVTLHFADGTKETASILVSAEGIHSKVRSTLFGAESDLGKPHYNQSGAYRAIVSMEKMQDTIGEDAHIGQAVVGPGGYIIHYPVNGGASVNIGAWLHKPGVWEDDQPWILPNQADHFKQGFKDFGPRSQKILALFDQNPEFWASFSHIHQPESLTDGRVIIIGDGAHSMPPHQGNGASQAVEDAYVLAEVLGSISHSNYSLVAVRAALKAVDEIRRPRYNQVKKISTEAGPRLYAFYNRKLEGAELEDFVQGYRERLHSIWYADLAGDADKAIRLADQIIKETGT